MTFLFSKERLRLCFDRIERCAKRFRSATFVQQDISRIAPFLCGKAQHMSIVTADYRTVLTKDSRKCNSICSVRVRKELGEPDRICFYTSAFGTVRETDSDRTD